MAQQIKRPPNELISLAIVVVVILGLGTMTVLVYARMAVELAERTRESISNRMMSVESQIASVYSLAADQAMNLMSLLDIGPSGKKMVQAQLGAIQAGLVGCTQAWIVPVGGSPIIAAGSTRSVIESRSWWQPYLEQSAAWGVEGVRFASLGVRKNIGYIAPAFRGTTGIGTILPLVVVRYSGIDRRALAFFEIDMTVILEGQLDLIADFSSGRYPLELSFYDSRDVLIESSLNLPLVRLIPFGPDVEKPPVLGVRSSILDYLFPGTAVIEAGYSDNRMGLTLVGRTPARFVMRGVLQVATYVLIVGAIALGSVTLLGFLLFHSFRRARSLEREQLFARFEALQAKVNPHFLFNTLDSMIGVAEGKDYNTLMRMLRSLSLMLRITVRRSRDIVTVGEELEYVRAYIAIQEVRYRDGFSTEWAIEDGALAAPICRFGLQPIVENCFTHGAREGMRGMKISIRARALGGDVVIEVEDDGSGCNERIRRMLADSFSRDENLLGREGGLFNLHTRIKMSFGKGYGIEVPVSGKSFLARLKVPGAFHTSKARGSRDAEGLGCEIEIGACNQR